MQRFHAVRPWATLVSLLFFCAISGAGAQPDAAPAAQPDAAPAALPAVTSAGLNAETIQGQRASVEADTSLAEEVKVSALDYYDRALRELETAGATVTETAALEAEIASANERITALSERLASPPEPDAGLDVPANATLEEIQALANERRADLTVAREHLNERERQLSELKSAGTTYSEQLAQREQELRRTMDELQATTASKDAPALVQAQQTFLQARQHRQESEIAFIRLGLGSYDNLVRLHTLERDAAAADLNLLEPQLAALDARLQEVREDKARVGREDAEALEAAAASLPAQITAIAEENTTLRTELEELTRRESETTERLRTTERRLADLETDLATTRERVQAVGASEAIGRLLRRRLARLPSPDDYKRLARERQSEITRVTDRRIDVEEESRDLGDLNQTTNTILDSIGPDVRPFNADRLRDETRLLLTAGLETLTELQQAYGRYLTRLAALDVAERRLIGSVNETANFINEQLFWIRSLPPFSFMDLAGLPQTLAWLGSPAQWTGLLQDSVTEFLEHPTISVLVILVVLGVFYVRSQTGKQLTQLATRTRQVRTDSFTHTVKAACYTLAAASAWPLVLIVASWHIRADPVGSTFSIAVAAGLMISAGYVFIFSVYHWLLHADGLGNRHFRWTPSITADLAKKLRWTSWGFVPPVFIVTLVRSFGETDYLTALGRPALVFAMLVIAVFVWRCFGKTSPATAHIRSKKPESWLARLWLVWFLVLLAIPLVLAVASTLGYVYTTVQVNTLLIKTIWYLVGLWILRDLLLRWFYVAERRLRLQAAIRHREELRERQKEEEKTDTESFEIEVPEVNYRTLGKQGRTIVRFGVIVGVVLTFGLLWGDLLPVLGFFDDVTLPLSKTVLVEGVETTVPVTLADIGLGLLVLIGTWLAAKNLSGVLEFTLLSRLNLDAGGRYAIITLCQYFIVAVGIIAGFSILGLQWSKLQWLDRCARRRPRLWSSGDRRQLRLRDHRAVGTPHPIGEPSRWERAQAAPSRVSRSAPPRW